VRTLFPHEHFEELCAMAAVGQASATELDELKAHLRECPQCRQTLGNFGQATAQAIPEIADGHAPVRAPAGMKQRFLARAYSEGVLLNREQGAARGWFMAGIRSRWGAIAVSAVLIAVASFLATRYVENSRHSRTSSAVRAAVKSGNENADPQDVWKQRLEAANGERTSLKLQVVGLERKLATELAEKNEVSARLTSVESVITSLQKGQQERDSDISQLRGQIAQLKEEAGKLRSERDAERVASDVQGNELRDLRGKVAMQAAELNERHQMTATAEQARDLIVARNLHIVDVHDTDEEGKGQRAFGRIFYTEGKSLVFYAYDLGDQRQVDAKISFYVWGEKLGATQPVRSLGIFHSDDPSDGRWLLTFDDPRILARINSVFVTVESGKKTISQPSGRKILYAFLGNKANHP
jgi:hypothetical protein